LEDKPQAPVVGRVDIVRGRSPRKNGSEHRDQRTGAAPSSQRSIFFDAEPVYGGQCDTPAFPPLPWIEKGSHRSRMF